MSSVMHSEIFFLAVNMAGLCAFLILTGRKTGFLEWLQARTPSWLPWGCNFCLGFWFSVIFTGIMYFSDPMTLVHLLVITLSTAINYVFTK